MKDLLARLFGRKRDATPVRDVAALAAPLAAPAVHVVTLDAPSLSHFGGSPELPPGVAWPERNRTRLGFLARLSLSEIHRAHPVPWLPESGALLFFYDMETQPWGFDPNDRGGAAVLLVPDLPAPIDPSHGGPAGEAPLLPHRNVGFQRIDVLPSWERDAARALDLTEGELDAYAALADAPFRGMPKHQVAGFPAPVQGDGMELESQLVSNGVYCGDPSGYSDPRVATLESGASNWRLLLQLDTDDDLGVMWGDCGTLYYWVEEQASRSGRFSNVWLILQCT